MQTKQTSQNSLSGFYPSHSFPFNELFSALAHFPIGIAFCDRRLNFTAVNRKLAEINDIPPREHPGRPVQEIVGELAPIIIARLEQVFRTGKPIYNAELVGRLGANPLSGKWVENYFPTLDDLYHVKQVGVLVVPLPGPKFITDRKRDLSGSSVLSSQYSSIPVDVASEVSPKTALNPLNSFQPAVPPLTARETDVLRELASGASSKEASSNLGISVKTVETYRTRLMLKLQATSLADLVHYAISHQVVELQK